MARVAKGKGVVLRPHVKTHKCAEVWADICAAGNTCGITVSTLEEAEYFHAHGANDILYAVGLAPGKIARIAKLVAKGARVTGILDDLTVVRLLEAAANEHGLVLPLMIELDVDGHRAGVDPLSDELLDLAAAIAGAPSLHLAGVMTHAGGSYAATDGATLNSAAQNEASLSVKAAERIRAAGFECEIVSIGSTPTALAEADLTDVTEIRAGVYTFFDLVMAGIGVAQIDEIALSVLATVIGYSRSNGCLVTDAGWMALSRDRGTQSQPVDQGYGLVCDEDTRPISDLIVRGCNQEHGIVGPRDPEERIDFAQYPLGTRLRILPNHACATAAQHTSYAVTESRTVVDVWHRTTGW
jgi:D-serine deaminase-like pyridoxal phosphate-dependent protein